MADRPDEGVPPPFDEYQAWLRRTFRHVPGVREGQAYFDVVAASLKRQFESSPFWVELQRRLPDYDGAYFVETGLGLMSLPHPGNVETKPWNSFLAKTYRRNVLHNSNFPDEPDGGWVLPTNWFAQTKDVLRTMFVVRYLDGVHELGSRIETLAGELGLRTESTLEGTSAGYYAGHVVAFAKLDVPTTGWENVVTDVPIEIQVTTQVQEVIKGLLHRTYELQRMQAEDNLEWQWDYDSRPFAAKYLGHILHYVEGRIMNVRAMDRRPEES
jgi:hypothetical protein